MATNYHHYLEQLNVARHFLKENKKTKFDPTNLALVYIHLKRTMPKNTSNEYNLAYSNLDNEVTKHSQSRLKLGKINKCPALFTESINDIKHSYPDAKPDYKKCIKGKLFTYHTLDKFSTKTLWKMVSLILPSVCSFIMAAVIFIVIMTNSLYLNPFGIIADIGLLWLGGAFLMATEEKFWVWMDNYPTTKRATANDLYKAVNDIYLRLVSKVKQNHKNNNYSHLVKEHYKELSNSKNNWSSIKKRLSHGKAKQKLVSQ